MRGYTYVLSESGDPGEVVAHGHDELPHVGLPDAVLRERVGGVRIVEKCPSHALQALHEFKLLRFLGVVAVYGSQRCQPFTRAASIQASVGCGLTR